MNFSLAQDSPFNTALMSEGHMLYRIETPSILTPTTMTTTTTVKRLSKDGLTEAEVGRVMWQSGRPATVVVYGHEINVTSKFFCSSRFFTALNGQSYKWSFEENDSLLMSSNDSRHSPAATYMRSTRSNPGLIHITPHGLTITADVLITFVCVEGERRNAQRRKTT